MENNRQVVEAFMSSLTVIPIFNSLDVYAKEKARLRSAGTIVDDFDLLIGATAIANKMVMVTRNERHFSRLESIVIENWIDSDK